MLDQLPLSVANCLEIQHWGIGCGLKSSVPEYADTTSQQYPDQNVAARNLHLGRLSSSANTIAPHMKGSSNHKPRLA
jgi:hypothetical protein